MTIKAKVTIATIYSIYNNETPSDTDKFLFLGNPSKSDVKTKYLNAMSNIKKATVCEVERVAVDIEVNETNCDMSFTDLLHSALEAKEISTVSTIL